MADSDLNIEFQPSTFWDNTARDSEARRIIGRASALKKYGLTTSQYLDILKEQNYRCAICSAKATSGRTLSVDHDHTTGIVRGLLCARCNSALGFVRDSPRILALMIVYLDDNGIHYPKIDD